MFGRVCTLGCPGAKAYWVSDTLVDARVPSESISYWWGVFCRVSGFERYCSSMKPYCVPGR